ncbi:MAG: hypothetical protein HKN41_12530 [Ilumatobacter sp.]|nr:hypothetical protein [Ilumatobacter sp.]
MTEHRRATLKAEVVLAIADLDQVRSNDPAAARAMHAVRLATMTLENFWLPVFDDVAVTD